MDRKLLLAASETEYCAAQDGAQDVASHEARSLANDCLLCSPDGP